MNPLIKEFGKQKRWVNYRLEKVNGKETKVPYSINGAKASSSDYSTWDTYEKVLAKSEKVGIMFGKKKTLLGIDIDKCLDEKGLIKKEYKESIEKLILEADTYCEYSPSKTGLHLFLKLKDPLDLKANRKGIFECYTTGRYFTFTGMPYGIENDVKEVESAEAERILANMGYPWKTDNEALKPTKSPTTSKMSDSELLERMFGSKNGADVKRLYNGDTSLHNGNESVSDMALCSHLAFWTGCDASQIERLWTGSPLGSREKTQKRDDYRERTIQNAIKNCREVYTNPNIKKEEENKELELLFKLDPKGNIIFIQNTENICRVLRRHEEFRDTLRYDEFKNLLEIKNRKTWKPLEDHDVLNVQTRISILFPYFAKVAKDMVYDAMIKIARENSYDSARDYITSIVWDKQNRLDIWLSKVYGVIDNEYHRKVGSNWLKGLVKRIVEPGCKFDYVLVLEGEQGIKKSTSLMTLGKDWHVETTMSTENKDFFMMFQGKAIIEFSEGETLSRTEVKRMKAIITMQSDKYRPAYGRLSVDFPRRCVFAMTTNQEEYLKDETGNRRWLPVACMGDANIEWLEGNRDQLLAEAYHRVSILKETTWEFPEEEMIKEQNARRIHDPYDDVISDWYQNHLSENDRQFGVTIFQAYREAIHNNSSTSKTMSRYEEMSIADVYRRVLKLIKKQATVNGVRATRWFRAEDAEEAEKLDIVSVKKKTELDKLVDDLKGF